MNDETVAAPRFSPRRLAHANLFVTELDRSMSFYNRVCGLEEVRREPGIAAGFLTNGNTHHDVGLMEIGDNTRTGIDGYVQVAKSRMRGAGLNHFGWELENEKQLVEAYQRARAAGVKIHRTTDHQISHSVYVFDPEANLNEFYADAMTDWRSIFNPSLDDLVSSEWDPDAAPPSATPKYNPDPDLRRVEDAAFHSLRITHAVLVARDIDRLRRFYEDVGGLTSVAESADGDFVCLKGTSAAYDLVLMAADDDLAAGLHHVSFEVADDDLDRGEQALAGSGIEAAHRIDNAAKRSVFLKDPDGLEIEFCRPLDRRAAIDLAVAGEKAMRPYLV
jgi:catechol 2,3-dioxygenase